MKKKNIIFLTMCFILIIVIFFLSYNKEEELTWVVPLENRNEMMNIMNKIGNHNGAQ